MYKLVIAGSREFVNYKLFSEKVDEYISVIGKEKIEIVSGGARGADSMAIRYAKEHNIGCVVFNADWDKFGKSAGYKRNAQMADYGDALLCFWDTVSKGTKHMIDLALNRKLNVTIITY